MIKIHSILFFIYFSFIKLNTILSNLLFIIIKSIFYSFIKSFSFMLSHVVSHMGIHQQIFLLAWILIIQLVIVKNEHEVKMAPFLCLDCLMECCLFMGSCLLVKKTHYLMHLLIINLSVTQPSHDAISQTYLHLMFLIYLAFHYTIF